MPSRLAMDVGGTHADLLLVDDASGRAHMHKASLLAHDPASGVAAALAAGLAELTRAAGIRPADIVEVVHGTSAPIDALVAGHGPRLGLLVTQGFEQVLQPPRMRGRESATTDTHAGFDLALTRGIAERISASGDAIAPLDEASARHAIGELLASGAQALTVCLLHAHANPAHELRVKALIREADEQIPVTLSHEISLEAGAAERATATVINAYVEPVMRHCLGTLEESLRRAEASPRVSIVQSTGARASRAQALATPVHALFAGQAGGAVGAAHVAALAGYPDALTIDMGGSSTHVALIRDGVARVSGQTTLPPDTALAPLNLSSLDVRTIAAGGAMLARTLASGSLQVAVPAVSNGRPAPSGSARAPSLTDANLVLGRFAVVPPSLDIRAAEERIGALARDLGVEPHRAAEGIVDIANENIAGALRRTALEKGLDPARLALVAHGGAGPMHACALGMLSGCTPVIVPRHAAVLPALGFLCAPWSHQFAQTLGVRLDDRGLPAIREAVERLQARAAAWLAREVPSKDGKVRMRADVGYADSGFQTSVSVDPASLRDGGSPALSTLIRALADAHRERFGFVPDAPARLVTLRAIASASADRFELPRFKPGEADPRAAHMRQVQACFDGAFLNTAVYDRERLQAGHHIAGPAIIAERHASTLIHPGHAAEVDAFHNLLIRPQGARASDHG